MYDHHQRIMHKPKRLPISGIIYASQSKDIIAICEGKNKSKIKACNSNNNNKAIPTPPSNNSINSDNTDSDVNSNELIKQNNCHSTLRKHNKASNSTMSLSNENIMEHLFINPDNSVNKSTKSSLSVKRGSINSTSNDETVTSVNFHNKTLMNNTNNFNNLKSIDKKYDDSQKFINNLRQRKNNELLTNYENTSMELCKLKLKYNQLTVENATLKQTTENLKTDIRNLRHENSNVKTRNEALTSKNLENQNLARIVENLNKRIVDMSSEMQNNQTTNSDKSLRIIQLEKIVCELKEKSSLYTVEIGYLKGQLEKKEIEIKQLMRSQHNDTDKDLRIRLIHNELIELKGNIRVICRIKPEPNNVLTVLNKETLQLPLAKSKSCPIYNFNRVMLPNSNQKDVFNEVKQLILSFVDGYNVSIITYGQSGTGKTHTMIGTEKEPGIMTHSIREVFTLCKKRSSWKYRVCLSVLEIYNEIIYDLLATITNLNFNSKNSNNKANWRKRTYIHDDGKCIHIKGLSEIEITNEDELLCYINKCIKLRSTSNTNQNCDSSRSHFIVLLRVYGRNLCDTCTTQGVLMLCDLAGSENCGNIQAVTCLTESKYISKSLTVLGRVFEALYNRQSPIVPFRDSKLTHILKPSLTGEAKFAFIVTVSGLMENLGSSFRTLNLAKKVAQISLGQPKKNLQNTNSIDSHSLCTSMNNKSAIKKR